MGKNKKLTPSMLLLKKHKEIWPWPSCKNPKTLSFRATADDSIFIYSNKLLAEAEVELTTPAGSSISKSPETTSKSTKSEKYFDINECSSTETIARGVMSERLFFEPDPTSSLIETQGRCMQCMPVDIGGHDDDVLPYKESVMIVMESENPYEDFKKSMEEMVESHDLKDWDRLEELLRWYLRTNGKNNHEFIVGAFVDLLVGISGGGDVAYFSSAASTFSPTMSSPLYQDGRERIIEEGKMVTN